jgi:hypothetical protein
MEIESELDGRSSKPGKVRISLLTEMSGTILRDRTPWLCGSNSCAIFWRSRGSNLVPGPTVLSEIFRGYHEHDKANVGIVS